MRFVFTMLILLAPRSQDARPILVAPTSGPAVATMPADPPIPAEKIIGGFMQHVRAGERFSAEAISVVDKAHKELTSDGSKQFLSFALAVLFPEFKRAADLLDADRPADAAAALEALTANPDPYLAVNAAVLAAPALMELEEMERGMKVLSAVRAAHGPVERYTLSPDQFEFALGYCQVHMLEYEAAQATLERFLRRYPDAPERLRVTATQIVTELSRRIPKQLGDVRDLLAFARRHIHQGDTGEPVRQRQQQAIAMLDDLIKDAEEQEKSQSSSSSGRRSKGGREGQQPGQGGGAKQSQLYRGAAPEANLRRTRAKPGEAWGRMPPKERDAILQSMQRQFPGRYRELLEQYYKQLAKESAAP